MLKSLICILALASALLATSLTVNAKMNQHTEKHVNKDTTSSYGLDPKWDMLCKLIRKCR